MAGLIEVGKSFLLRFGGRKDTQHVSVEKTDPRFSTIAKIVDKASSIWFDNKGKKSERRGKAAHELIQYLSSEVTSDPKFYQQINLRTHTSALQLLIENFIPPSGEKFEEFMQSEQQKIIESYLRGFVENGATIFGLDSQTDKLKDAIASHLRTMIAIPRHYAEVVYPKIDLQLLLRTETF